MKVRKWNNYKAWQFVKHVNNNLRHVNVHWPFGTMVKSTLLIVVQLIHLNAWILQTHGCQVDNRLSSEFKRCVSNYDFLLYKFYLVVLFLILSINWYFNMYLTLFVLVYASNTHAHLTTAVSLKRGTCIKGLFWPPLEPKTENFNCFSPISSYWVIRRIAKV